MSSPSESFHNINTLWIKKINMTKVVALLLVCWLSTPRVPGSSHCRKKNWIVEPELFQFIRDTIFKVPLYYKHGKHLLRHIKGKFKHSHFLFRSARMVENWLIGSKLISIRSFKLDPKRGDIGFLNPSFLLDELLDRIALK